MQFCALLCWLFERGQDVVPHLVDFRLHILERGSDSYDSVLFRDDDDVLTIHAVRAEGVMPAPPHLVAITLSPVAFPDIGSVWVFGLIDFRGGRLVDPGFI